MTLSHTSLERRDEAFKAKMAEVLSVYRVVAVLRANDAARTNVAIISYDVEPCIQAIDNTASDLSPRLLHSALTWTYKVGEPA